MATQLIVRFKHLNHRFVKTTKVKLELTGPPEPEDKTSKFGTHVFNIAPSFIGNSLKLTIEIPVPPVMLAAGLTSPPLMSVQQILEVVRTSSGLPTLRPHPSSPGNRFVGGLHPRLTSQSVNSGGGHIVYIDVDNTFLKVNRLAGAANKPFTDPYTAATKPILPGAASHYGCRLNLYEYTGGRPNLWPVLIPPAVKDDLKTVHAFIFFRPATALNYTGLEDADSRSLMRYLLDPDAAAPFFVNPAKTTATKIDIVTKCGFERSMSEAKKPVIFVSPLPHVSDYGHAGTEVWPDLMKSLIIALWAEDDIGQKVAQGLVLGRVAAGGFSFGGLTAFSMLSAALALKAVGGKVPDPLHELYLFDCREFTDTDQANIRTWFAKGGKKVRMIGGGLFHGKMLALAAQMKSPDVTVIPASADDWVSNALYKAAVSFHKFDASTSAAATTGSVSDLTGVFLVGATGAKPGTVLQGRDRSNTAITPNQNVLGFGSEELTAGSMLYNDSFRATPKPNALDKEFRRHKPPETPPPVPLDSAANFPRLVTAVQGRCKAIRHQWAVVGGQDSGGKTDRLATFKGFLQLCLEQGNLP